MRTLLVLFVLAFSTAALADGAATFSSKCKGCHGPEGAGTKIAPNPIAGTPAEQVKKVITEGKGKMKPVAIDNADEVAASVAGLKKK